MSSKAVSGYSGIYVQVTSSGEFALSYGDGTGFSQFDRRTIITSSSHLYINKWVHCAFVVAGPMSGKIYINGVEVPTTFTGTGGAWFQSPMGTGGIGVNHGGSGLGYHSGDIDDLTIWNKALSQTEIQNLVCRKTNGNNPLLLGYYNFDSSLGNKIFDSSPNAHDGTFVGAISLPQSGAAIGDTSYYYYANVFSGFSTFLSNGQPISVSNISASSNGVQIYEVFSAPNSSSGIPVGTGIQQYFGVFLAVTDNATKTYNLELSNFTGKQLYKRTANNDLTWSLVNPISVSGGLASFPADQLRQEYTIISGPVCRLDLGPDTTVECGPINIWIKDLQYDSAKSYLWSNGSTTDSILITAPGQYYVKMDSLGCVRFDTVNVIKNCDNECDILPPNVFTPNGDLNNDFYRLQDFNCTIAQFSIQIFNRWGNMVYDSDDEYFKWDGTYNGTPLSDGAYLYMIKYSQIGNQMIEKNGILHLIR
jgi:gliding motility-associated-like protein